MVVILQKPNNLTEFLQKKEQIRWRHNSIGNGKIGHYAICLHIGLKGENWKDAGFYPWKQRTFPHFPQGFPQNIWGKEDCKDHTF